MKKTLVVLLAVLAVNASLFAEDANFRGARLADAEEALMQPASVRSNPTPSPIDPTFASVDQIIILPVVDSRNDKNVQGRPPRYPQGSEEGFSEETLLGQFGRQSTCGNAMDHAYQPPQSPGPRARRLGSREIM